MVEENIKPIRIRRLQVLAEIAGVPSQTGEQDGIIVPDKFFRLIVKIYHSPGVKKPLHLPPHEKRIRLPIMVPADIVYGSNGTDAFQKIRKGRDIPVISIHHIPGEDNDIRLAVLHGPDQSVLAIPEFLQMEVRELDDGKSIERERHLGAGIFIRGGLEPRIQAEYYKNRRSNKKQLNQSSHNKMIVAENGTKSNLKWRKTREGIDLGDLVSVVVPVYNVEKYLAACIDSLLAQTYGNIEIILVDDGSKDRCPEICDKYSQADGRIRVIHQENRGPAAAAARNKGIAVSKGRYLIFVDSDDWVEKEYVENLYRLLTETKADIGACGFKDQYEGRTPKASAPMSSGNTILFNRTEGLRALLYQVPFDSALWAKIFKRELFDDQSLPEGRMYEDFAAMYRIFQRAASIAYNPWDGYYYFHRAEGIMRQRFSLNKMDLIEFAEEMKEELLPLYPELGGAIWSRYFRANCHIYFQIPEDKAFKEQRRQIEDNLRKSRLKVLQDAGTRTGTKIGALCTYLGFPLFRRLEKWKEAGKK